MLRAWHRGQAVDHLERVRIDHVDLAGHEVGRIDPRRLARDSGTEHAGAGAGVDVVRIDRRGHREVCRRQKDRPLGTELIGGKGDKVGRGAALLKDAAADVCASGAFDARVRNGEGLRAAQFETGADCDRHRRDDDKAVANSHPLPFSTDPPSEPQFGATGEAKLQLQQ